MKSTRILIAVAGFMFALIVISACNGEKGGIPVNNDRARVHIIPIKQADAYRDAFTRTKDTLRRLISDVSFLDSQFNLPVAEAFNRDAIALLLNQKDADGIRIYLGRDEKGQVRFVLLPVDKNGKDIRRKLLDDKTLTQKAAAQPDIDLDGEAVEVGQRCPTICN
jgi:hypothetical protein